MSRMMSSDSTEEVEMLSDQAWLAESATVLTSQKEAVKSVEEGTLTDAWQAFVKKESPAPPLSPSPTYWGNTHQEVLSTPPIKHPNQPHSRVSEASNGSTAPNPSGAGTPPTPNLSPHRPQHNSTPSITLTPLPAPLPVSTPPKDALLSNSATVSAFSATSPLHSSSHTPLALRPSESKVPPSHTPTPPTHPSLLHSITNTSTEIDGVDSNLPYLEFVPSPVDSTTTAPTHVPVSPTASSQHTWNLVHTPSTNTLAATPVPTPPVSPPGSPYRTRVAWGPVAASTPRNPDASAASNVGDFSQRTLPEEFRVDGPSSGALGSDALLSEMYGTVTHTDSVASGTPAASVSLAIGQSSPQRVLMSTGVQRGSGDNQGRHDAAPSQPTLAVQSPAAMSPEAMSVAHPYTPEALGEPHLMGAPGATSGASSAPPSPNPMMPLGSAAGRNSQQPSTNPPRQSSVATGDHPPTHPRTDSLVSPLQSPHDSFSQQPLHASSGSPFEAAVPMHAAHVSSAVPDHASARDAADSTALSLALEDMERRVLGQLEDEQLLSARGLRVSVGSDSRIPPRPSPRPSSNNLANSRANSLTGGSIGRPDSVNGSHPGSHRSSVELPDDAAVQEHFLEDSMAMLYPSPPQSVQGLDFLEDSEELPQRHAALHSVPVNALQRHSTEQHSAARSGGIGLPKQIEPMRRGHSSSGVQRGPERSAQGTQRSGSGHRRAASHMPGRGGGGRSGSYTSRPCIRGHTRCKSGVSDRGDNTQRPAWGVRSDPSIAAKRASIQSLHTSYSMSAQSKAQSLWSTCSVGAASSACSTRSKPWLHRGGSAGSTGAAPASGAPCRAGPGAAAQRARASARLAGQGTRGVSFGAPPARGRGGSVGGRGGFVGGARRPATARPAMSSPSPLKPGFAVSASYGSGSAQNKLKTTSAVHASKLPTGSHGGKNKLRSGTSAASIRSTTSGSSRIAAVPAHAMSSARVPSRSNSGAGSAGATKAGVVRTGNGTHSNSSSAAQLHSSSHVHGSLTISDNMLASVDHSNAPGNLSDVLSDELAISATAISENLGSATTVNPFLPMFPAALGADIFSAAKNEEHARPEVDSASVPSGGKVFKNVPESSGVAHLDGEQQLAHASSQFVRGKLAAGLSSPEPKGASVKVAAAHMHGQVAPTHDAVNAMHARDDIRVDDVNDKLANPQPSPMLMASMTKHGTATYSTDVSPAPSPRGRPPTSSKPSTPRTSDRADDGSRPFSTTGGNNTTAGHNQIAGLPRRSVSKPLSNAPSSPAHSQTSFFSNRSGATSTAGMSGKVTMSRRQLAARNEAISNSRSPSPRPSSARGPSGSLDRMGAALGMSPVQSMTPTDGGQAAVPPAKPVGLQHPQPQPASQANKVTTGSAEEDKSDGMDVVVSVVGPCGAQVPPSTPGGGPATPTPLSPTKSAGSGGSSRKCQNDMEGGSGGAKDSAAHSATAGSALLIKVSEADSVDTTGVSTLPARRMSADQGPPRKKYLLDSIMCCFAPPQVASE